MDCEPNWVPWADSTQSFTMGLQTLHLLWLRPPGGTALGGLRGRRPLRWRRFLGLALG